MFPAGSVLAGDVPTVEQDKDDDMMGHDVTFMVRIENISGDSDLASPFAPGVWVLHSEARPHLHDR